MHIKLVGTDKNRNAIGAKILLKSANTTQVQEVYAGESYMSANGFIVEFGLGKATKVDMIQVIWSNGKTQTLQNVSANQKIQIIQNP